MTQFAGQEVGAHTECASATSETLCHLQGKDLGHAQLATRRCQQPGDNRVRNFMEAGTQRQILR